MDQEVGSHSQTDLRRGPPYWAIVAIILFGTAATRFSAFGNPTYSADDPVFLLIGQAILDGQIPYVDIWDRKPIGTYLIFAGIRLLGGDGVVQSQIVAGLFVAATALTIERICRHFSSPQGSLLAALTYLIFLPMFRGASAQISLFYNFFMALAALVVVRAITGDRPPAIQACLVAMLLCGVSLILKQTTAVEGCLFGIWLLAIGYKRGWSLHEVAGRAALMVGTALLPLLLSFAVYYWLGHFNDYWFAAFESNSLRSIENVRRIYWRIGLTLLWSMPLIAIAMWGAFQRNRHGPTIRFLLAWLALALVGYAIIPRGHLYYFISVLLPLAVLSSIALDRTRGGYALFAGLIFWSILQGAVASRSNAVKSDKEFRALSQAVSRELDGGCLFVAHGPPLLYLATGSCRVSPYVFPNHLFTRVEAGATPVPADAEVGRALAQKPKVILFDTLEDGEFRNSESTRLLRQSLANDYRSVGRYPQLVDDIQGEYEVWVRR